MVQYVQFKVDEQLGFLTVKKTKTDIILDMMKPQDLYSLHTRNMTRYDVKMLRLGIFVLGFPYELCTAIF
jgi:hypothetical protein